MNFLYDDVFRVKTKEGSERLTLPSLLSRLAKNDVDHFVGMQRHQADAFHVFLSYLAAAVLARCSIWEPKQDEAFWREGLLNLAGKSGKAAWQLIQEDITQAAFMQPPLPKDAKATSEVAAADQLDVLQTAKNHDVKRTRAAFSSIDTWVYSLISLQTMSGFLGRGNQGISRMNSGFGNRAIVELLRTKEPGQRWLDALARLKIHRQELAQSHFGYSADGLVLVWLMPWDGETSLELAQLDPFYIEICRRVRLRRRGTSIVAQLYSAEKPRIAAKDLKGAVGDAWLPVDLKEVRGRKEAELRALTFPAAGINAEHMRRLIFKQAVKLSPLQNPLDEWQEDLWLSASVLIRGQGTTDGFYEWDVLIPKEKVVSIFGRTGDRSLEALSRESIEQAAVMQNRVLKPAVFAHILGAPDQLRLDDEFATAIWANLVREFEVKWSGKYFPWLFSVPEKFAQDQEIRRWVEILRDIALEVLEKVEAALPGHGGRTYRIRTQVRNRFWGGLYRHFEFLRRENGEHTVST